MNSNLIQHETDRALLIKLPKSDFKFWHPKSLCRISGKRGYLLAISYTVDFKFKIFRTGTRNNVLESKELEEDDFLKYFEQGE